MANPRQDDFRGLPPGEHDGNFLAEPACAPLPKAHEIDPPRPNIWLPHVWFT
jgi:hypothetical protein